jgi:Fic family protein
MNYGLDRLKTVSLSLRLIREIHGKLLTGVRGANRTPGEFRTAQNWIGPSGCTLATATFVPPPVPEMQAALDNVGKFLHDDSLPLLIQCGLAQAQFEAIHPFLDGNGRVGRL